MSRNAAQEEWHAHQDRQITDALAAIDAVFDNPYAGRRAWGLSDALLADAHLLNVNIAYRRSEPIRVLDVGCGSGDILARVVTQFPLAECVGIDANAESIARARARSLPRTTFQHATFDAAAGIFDIVICSEVYEHVTDPCALLDTLVACLRPGGCLSISTPSGWMYRTPRAYNLYKFFKNPRRFLRLYWFPERHWSEALAVHPGVRPSVLRRQLEARHLAIVLRQSSLWWLQQPGLAYGLLAYPAGLNAPTAASMVYHGAQLLEGLMNVCPPLRVFETRAVFLGQRQP